MSGALKHSPADIVRWAFIGVGLGTDPMLTLAWPIFQGKESDLPDNCITLYNTTGTMDGRTMVDGEQIEHHGFQVRIRATSEKVGFLKARAIAVGMDQLVYAMNVTLDSSSYRVHCVNRVGDVLPLGRESPTSNRMLFTINAKAPIRELT